LLALLLEGFTFTILGLHSDSESEFVNHGVAKLLDKLHIEFTKSRSRQTDDNTLVHYENGAVIHKLTGYGHIPQKHAAAINSFYTKVLDLGLNFHRFC